MISTIGKLFALLSSREKKQIMCLFIALLGMAGIDMAGIASILPFMAVVANPDVIQTNQWLKKAYDFFQFSSLRSFLFFLGMMVLGLLVFSNLFKGVYTWVNLKYDNRLHYTLARRLLAAYLARPYEFYLHRNTADLGKNVLQDVRTVISGVLSPALQLLSSVLLCILIMGLLMIVNPTVAAAIVVILGGLYAAIYFAVRNRLNSIGEGQLFASTMKVRAASDALSGIKDLKILGREAAFLEKFTFHARDHAEQNAQSGAISQIPRYALETIAFGGILMIVLYSIDSEQEVGTIVPLLSIYAFAGYRLMPALQQIFSSVSAIRVSAPTLDVLHRDLESGGRKTGDAVLPAVDTIQPMPFSREIELRDVTFRYSQAKSIALNAINLSIASNTSVGLVGATGSGKTTTVDIILGLLDPTAGQLCVDGVEITRDNLSSWQRNLGYVPQSIYLCDDTVVNNIAFGVPEHEIDMAAVIRAARIANLHSFIENELPKGYKTFIGERGLRLSGGQRQRIGIARALYRDPSVLIMDEATSALDGITEEAVMDALRTLSGEKTIILIAHRLTTVKDCTVIYLLDQGRIVSQGTYDEMLASSSWFQSASRTGA